VQKKELNFLKIIFRLKNNIDDEVFEKAKEEDMRVAF